MTNKMMTNEEAIDLLTRPFSMANVSKDILTTHKTTSESVYTKCSDAMMQMWLDDVLTDGEYSRIMEKLNAKWGKRGKE